MGLPDYVSSAIDGLSVACYQRGQWTALPRGKTKDESRTAAAFALKTRVARYELTTAIERYAQSFRTGQPDPTREPRQT